MVELSKLDKILIVLSAVFIAMDIVLALCISVVLPDYVTQRFHYYPDGESYEFEEAAERCPCMYEFFPKGTKDGFVTMARIDAELLDSIRRSQAYASGRSQDDVVSHAVAKRALTEKTPPFYHNYLVALTVPAYSDDPDQWIFACNGLALKPDLIITTEICVYEDSEWTQLKAAHQTYTWYKEGDHSVVDFYRKVENPGFVYLKIDPQFEPGVYEPELSFLIGKPQVFKDEEYAVCFGWDDQIYRKELKFRIKNAFYGITGYRTTKKHDGINIYKRRHYVCRSKRLCGLTSRFLVSSCHTILGAETAPDEETCGAFGGLHLDAPKALCWPTAVYPMDFIKKCESKGRKTLNERILEIFG